ncbi:hypothetical protein HY408_02005 [Candidatus Gottesmanbacteria bacterium]|nr:hypothetical protein [Candidatus Gottesmanbacteria bacterium]
MFDLTVSSTFVDTDAFALVSGVYYAAKRNMSGLVNLRAIISTRDYGDNRFTDTMLTRVQTELSEVPLLRVSAKQQGRLRDRSVESQENYDWSTLDAIYSCLEELPHLHFMLGDMIIRGPRWCNDFVFPSLNLHPDLPLNLGGTEGIYWDVIGEWVKSKRAEIGGMVHLAVPTLDAGTAVAYFRLPARGRIKGADLSTLWDSLPEGQADLGRLVKVQTALRDHPTHLLFQELRRAEAAFELELVLKTLKTLAEGQLFIDNGKVYGRAYRELPQGLDLTDAVVGAAAIWPGREGGLLMQRDSRR